MVLNFKFINNVNCFLFLYAEFINGSLLVGAFRSQYARWEVTLVRSVGEVLCFEADGTSGREGSTFRTFESAQPIAGVELYARLGGIHFEISSAIRLQAFSCKSQASGFTLVQHVAMIVSGTDFQLSEAVIVDAFAYDVRCAEVHWSTFYRSYFAGRDTSFVYRCVPIGIDGDEVVFYGCGRIGQAREAEECMVSKVDQCLLVGIGRIVDDKFVVVREGVGDGDVKISGETFFAIG